jgi:hypothetical protein
VVEPSGRVLRFAELSGGVRMTTTGAVEFLPPARTLLSGLVMVEGARWHEGRLWFAHWGIGEVMAVDLDGTAEVIAPGPPRMGWAFDWLPDGRLITTGAAHTGAPGAPGGACVRVLEGGEITHRVEVELPCFACGLGGPDGRQPEGVVVESVSGAVATDPSRWPARSTRQLILSSATYLMPLGTTYPTRDELEAALDPESPARPAEA